MSGALWIAWTTLRRARVVRIAAGIAALGPAAITLVFFAAAGSDSGGLAQAKLEAFATDRTWSSFLGASAQITSVGLLLAGGVVAAWWFGRDFENGTFAMLFARAVPRVGIAAARLALLVTGAVATVVAALAATLAAGATLELDRPGDIASSAATFIAAGALTIAMFPLVALAASLFRSVTGAFGVLLGIVLVTQLGMMLGSGAWVPSAVPELLAGIGGADAAAAVQWPHVCLLLLLGCACTAATLAWWARARVR